MRTKIDAMVGKKLSYGVGTNMTVDLHAFRVSSGDSLVSSLSSKALLKRLRSVGLAHVLGKTIGVMPKPAAVICT